MLGRMSTILPQCSGEGDPFSMVVFKMISGVQTGVGTKNNQLSFLTREWESNERFIAFSGQISLVQSMGCKL